MSDGLKVFGEFKDNEIQKVLKIIYQNNEMEGVQADDKMYFGLDTGENAFSGEGFCFPIEEKFFFQGPFNMKLLNGLAKVRDFEGQYKKLLFENYDITSYNIMVERKLPDGVSYGGKARPDGVRMWTPYQSWELTELIHSTDHALCYVPTDTI